ncbi:carboxypeptidase M32 [Anaeromyxobacter sp. Fw109-5]|uniref:carboxypeptidase M32 n=1 Tax=Anaeromyxobacter sp. (strain Fw109-5) TaxID=404589 RepID=UPI000158A77E|nr:carboxypeptidase M32 [Anaeromyxobacter sp. Fw109-5]ABS24347.1 Carboxypeptidase Taq [Anaeromyxobacter sp. Fw109-5]
MADPAPSPRSAAWETLAAVMSDVRALGGAVSLLQWDQETFMPARGAAARGDQLAVVQAALHERLTSRAVAEALDRAERDADGDPDRAAALRALRFDHERAARVPQELVRALAQAQAEGIDAWKAARAERSFARFAPSLERLLALRREQADALLPMLERRAQAQPEEAAPERAGGPGGRGLSRPPGKIEPYDALLEGYEPGMRVARLAPILQRLAGWLAPVVAAIDAAPAPEDGFLAGRFDAEAQWSFTLELLQALGFDPAAGRQDRSVHPFTLGLDPGDVRITTRIHEDQPLSAIFSTLHEAGHGLYEQHLPAQDRRSLLCAAPSMGLHESQSRLWENLVGRSLPFWRAFLPRLAARFPRLAGVAPEDFHRAANRVRRSLVRVEADEVTYNLHIALRFELELGLLRGALAVRELPEAWAARSEALLGVRPRHDVEGVLQDIHWAWGDLGYFPTYTIGNLYAATLYAAAARSLPGLDEALARGELAPLRVWLAERVYRVGRRKDAEEIVRDATGEGLTDRDFERYVKTKYGALYGLSLAG